MYPKADIPDPGKLIVKKVDKDFDHTWIKKTTDAAKSLSSKDKCPLKAGRALFYKDAYNVDKHYFKVTMQSVSADCDDKNFPAGTEIYLYKPHFVFEKR